MSLDYTSLSAVAKAAIANGTLLPPGPLAPQVRPARKNPNLAEALRLYREIARPEKGDVRRCAALARVPISSLYAALG